MKPIPFSLTPEPARTITAPVNILSVTRSSLQDTRETVYIDDEGEWHGNDPVESTQGVGTQGVSLPHGCCPWCMSMDTTLFRSVYKGKDSCQVECKNCGTRGPRAGQASKAYNWFQVMANAMIAE